MRARRRACATAAASARVTVAAERCARGRGARAARAERAPHADGGGGAGGAGDDAARARAGARGVGRRAAAHGDDARRRRRRRGRRRDTCSSRRPTSAAAVRRAAATTTAAPAATRRGEACAAATRGGAGDGTACGAGARRVGRDGDAERGAEWAAWSARLPDPRLPDGDADGDRAARGGVRGAARRCRDGARRGAARRRRRWAAAATAMATPAEAPLRRAHACAPQPTYVALPSVSWRPGAAAARIEQLGAQVDARVTAAWGEPSRRGAAGRGASSAQLGGATMVAQPVALDATPASAPRRRGRADAGASRARGDATTRSAPSLRAAAIETMYVAPEMRATGPARMAAFVQQLVGVQAARATAPLPVQRDGGAHRRQRRGRRRRRPGTVARRRVRRAGAARERGQPARAGADRAGGDDVAGAAGARDHGRSAASARRAEQLGGAVGVRAASLSIDFVDPARFALLAERAPSMPTVAPAGGAAGAAIRSCRRRGRCSPRPRARGAGAERRGVVAGGHVPVGGDGGAAGGGAQRRSGGGVAAPATTLRRRWRRRARARRAPGRVAAARRSAGRVRGAVADGVGRRRPSRSGCRAGACRAAASPGRSWPSRRRRAPSGPRRRRPPSPSSRQAAQAAPGMPLWGALPRLETVSPSLAASTGMTSADERGAGGARRRPRARRARRRGGADGRRAVPAPRARAERRRAGIVGDARRCAGDDLDDRGGDARGARGRARSARREARRAAERPRADARRGRRRTARARRGRLERACRAAMPLMSAGPTAARDGGARRGRPGRARARAGAPVPQAGRRRPHRRDGDARASVAAPRFFEQPQPLVAGAPSSDSTARIVEALRSQPAAASGDDRVSLADLTLIAIASATQQVAASPAGGGPAAAVARRRRGRRRRRTASSAGGGGKSAEIPRKRSKSSHARRSTSCNV